MNGVGFGDEFGFLLFSSSLVQSFFVNVTPVPATSGLQKAFEWVNIAP